MQKRNIAQYRAFDAPSDWAAAAVTGDWISMANFNHIEIIIIKAAGAVGEPATFTIRQATSAAGAGAKALNFTRYTRMSGADLTAVTVPTDTTVASGNTLVLAAGNVEDIIVIEFDASELDVSNGFYFVQCSLADVGSTAQLGVVIARLSEPRYEPTLINATA